jgi:AhpD family alkylhydroperoxidase
MSIKANRDVTRRTIMPARMTLPGVVLPGALQALTALWRVTKNSGVPSTTLDFVSLRASQINGCAPCLDMHARLARKAGETEERLTAVAAWR